MLGKLLKYELLAEMRKYAVVFAAIIGAAVLFLVFDRGLSRLGDYAIIDIFSGFLLIAFILLCFFTLAMIIVMSCVRFKKNLFGDEGYLMHTLPVPAWQHIAVKIIAAYIWTVAALIVIVIGICILTCSGSWMTDMYEGMKEAFAEISAADDASAALLFNFKWFFIITSVLYPLLLLLYIYFCIAVGSLFNSHKTLMSILTFVVVNTVGQIVNSVIMVIGGLSSYMSMDTADMNAATADMFISSYGKLMWGSSIFSVILYAAMAICTNYIMSKKLNLE